jgi:hypothetical protein
MGMDMGMGMGIMKVRREKNGDIFDKNRLIKY